MEIQPKIQPIYYVFLGIALLVYVGQNCGLLWPYLVRNYLNDVLVMPLMFKTITIVLKWRFGQSFVLTNVHLMIVLVYFSVLFEYIFPKYLPRYTADYFDVLAYLVGSLIFKLIECYGAYKMHRVW